MATARQTKPEENEVTRPSDLGFPSAQYDPREIEIEVEPVAPPRAVVADDGFVEIRMAETIEEFTYGNPHLSWRLERGKRYRVPRHIAAYLWDLGKLQNR